MYSQKKTQYCTWVGIRYLFIRWGSETAERGSSSAVWQLQETMYTDYRVLCVLFSLARLLPDLRRLRCSVLRVPTTLDCCLAWCNAAQVGHTHLISPNLNTHLNTILWLSHVSLFVYLSFFLSTFMNNVYSLFVFVHYSMDVCALISALVMTHHSQFYTAVLLPATVSRPLCAFLSSLSPHLGLLSILFFTPSV